MWPSVSMNPHLSPTFTAAKLSENGNASSKLGGILNRPASSTNPTFLPLCFGASSPLSAYRIGKILPVGSIEKGRPPDKLWPDQDTTLRVDVTVLTVLDDHERLLGLWADFGLLRR